MQTVSCRLSNRGPDHEDARAVSCDPRASAELRVGRTARVALACMALLMAADRCLAVNAADHLFVPTVTQGEREIDFYAGSGTSGETTRAESNAGLGYGYGVTQHWFTELDVEYRWQSPVGTGLDALEWENILQIGEPGQWPVDIGLLCNVEKPYEASRNSPKSEGTSIRFGPLLQKDFGRVEANLNLLLTHFFQSDVFSSTQFGYQGQIKYRYSPPLEVGIQAFGRLSSGAQSWAPYPQQVLRVGPVVLGRLRLPQERSLSYNIGFLLGTTQHSPDQTLRLQIEYEF